jgi:hypothetical protein
MTNSLKFISLAILVVGAVGCSKRIAPDRTSAPAVTTCRVNLRSGPGTSFPLIHILDGGTQVRVMSRSGIWYQVECNNQSGYISSTYLSLGDAAQPKAPTENHSRVLATSKTFNLRHAQILKGTGWYEYVNSNIDVLRYYNWSAFQHENGPAVGLSYLSDGERVVLVATKDRSEEDVVATLVHEAAHCEFGTRYRSDGGRQWRAQSEAYAQETARRFLDDYNRWIQGETPQPRCTCRCSCGGQ